MMFAVTVESALLLIHGDLTDAILDYIPKRRVNDVVY